MIKADAYRLPYMDTILCKLQKAKFVSTLDLSQAYHQIPMEKKAGLFQFTRMPYGLSYVGASFQRLIKKVIGPEMEPYAFSNLDDVIIATETLEEHVKWLKHILGRIKEAGLTINLGKSVFGKTEVKYPGVLMIQDGSGTDPEKIRPNMEYAAPRNLRQLRRFLGMASWYRKFLQDFATLTDPLTGLTTKGRKYEWGKAQETALQTTKALIASVPSRPGQAEV